MALMLRVSNYGRWVAFGLDHVGNVEIALGWYGRAAWKVERGRWYPGSLEVVTPCLALYASVGRDTETHPGFFYG